MVPVVVPEALRSPQAGRLDRVVRPGQARDRTEDGVRLIPRLQTPGLRVSPISTVSRGPIRARKHRPNKRRRAILRRLRKRRLDIPRQAAHRHRPSGAIWLLPAEAAMAATRRNSACRSIRRSCGIVELHRAAIAAVVSAAEASVVVAGPAQVAGVAAEVSVVAAVSGRVATVATAAVAAEATEAGVKSSSLVARWGQDSHRALFSYGLGDAKTLPLRLESRRQHNPAEELWIRTRLLELRGALIRVYAAVTKPSHHGR